MEKLVIGLYCLDAQVPNLSSTRLSIEYFIDLKAIVLSRQWYCLFLPHLKYGGEVEECSTEGLLSDNLKSKSKTALGTVVKNKCIKRLL